MVVSPLNAAVLAGIGVGVHASARARAVGLEAIVEAVGSKAQVGCLSRGLLKDVVATVRRRVGRKMRGARWASQQEDVVQNVLLTFYRRVDDGTLDLSGDLTGWLNVTADLTVKDHWRRARRRRQDELSDDGVLPDVEEGSGWPDSERPEGVDARLSRTQADRIVRGAISELEPLAQQVVFKHYAEEKSYPTIADELGLREHQVKHLHKGVREILRKRLSRVGIVATPALLAALLGPRRAGAVSVPPPSPRVLPVPSLWARLMGLVKGGFALTAVCTAIGGTLGLAHAGLTTPDPSTVPPLSSVRREPDWQFPRERPQGAAPVTASAPEAEAPSTQAGASVVIAPNLSSPPPVQLGNGVSGAAESISAGPRKAPTPSKPSPKTRVLDFVPATVPAAPVMPMATAPAPPFPVLVHAEGDTEIKEPIQVTPGTAGVTFALKKLLKLPAGPAIPILPKPEQETPKTAPWTAIQNSDPAAASIPGATPSVSTPDCHVAFSIPANGAAQQAITEDILISWTSPVDVDSLADAIALTLDGQESVAFSIEPVDETTVKVIPSDSLRFWGSYQLHLKDGVSTPSGSPCEPATVAFSTIALAPEARPPSPLPVSGVWFDGNHLYTISINGQALQVFALPPSGVPSLEREILAPTPVWGTVRALGAMVAVPAGGAGWWRVSPDGAVSKVIPTGGDAKDVAMFSAGAEVHVIVAAGAGGLRWFSAPAGDPAGAVSDHGAFDPGVGIADIRKVAASSDGSTLAFVDGASVRVTSCQGPALSGGCATVSMVPPAGVISDIELDGSRLFAGSSLGVFAYDLSMPDAPPSSPCGPAAECGVTDIHARNGEVVAAAGPKGAHRFQLEGANLVAKGTYGVDDVATSVVSDGTHVLIGTQAGPWSFEATTGAVVASDPAGFGEPFDVLFVDNIAYVAAGARGLLTYEVSPNGTFVWRDQDLPPGTGPQADPSTAGSSRGLSVFHGQLLVADWLAGVSVYDLSDPAHPTHVRTIDFPDRTTSLAVYDDRAYACAENAGVVRFDPSSDTLPPAEDQLVLWEQGRCQAMAVVEDVLYVGGTSTVPSLAAFLGALDLANTGPLSWKIKMLRNEYHAFRAIKPVNDHLVLATRTTTPSGEERRLLVLDPHAPDGPQIVWKGEDTQALHISVAGSLAFVSSLAKGVAVYDMSDPLDPLVMGTIPFSGLAMSSSLRDSALFVLEAGMPIDPQAPRLAGRGLRRVVTGPLPQ